MFVLVMLLQMVTTSGAVVNISDMFEQIEGFGQDWVEFDPEDAELYVEPPLRELPSADVMGMLRR